jgi:polyhydroxybutyrate depolymerase
MSYRMAQEYPEVVASIASLAGGMDRVSSLPTPPHPVSVLEIHGTLDAIIPYAGGKPTTIPGLPPDPAPVTGARESIERWAQWNGCSGLEDDGEPSLDLDSALPGLDTVVTKTANCTDGISAELWTINGANHFPAFTPQFASELVSWLLNHPKP